MTEAGGQAARSLIDTAGRLRLGLRAGLVLECGQENDLVVRSAFGALVLTRITGGLLAAFDALTSRSATVDQLADLVLSYNEPGTLARLYHHLEQLGSLGWIDFTALSDGVALARVEGVDRRFRFCGFGVDPLDAYLLSRFAVIRRIDQRYILESPIGHARVDILDQRVVAICHALSRPRCAQEIADTVVAVDRNMAVDVLRTLLEANALTPVDQRGRAEEDNDPLRAQWDANDLLFHTRSRFGRHSNPFGATFRHIGTVDPEPAIKSPMVGDLVPLDRPDLEYLVVHDQPLARVMEERETRYEYDSNRPISLSQLGEFLYRVARVRSLLDTPVNNHTGASAVMQLSNRPYPAGGRIYELEFYLAVNTTLDLAPGLYHYDPLGHHLVRLRPKDATVEALLRYTTYAAPKGGNPQVLIVLAARFQRMSWKYDSIAYAATLKHVGILLQSMYLVATAMNLAPCALGSGDSEAFAEAAGTDYLAETSVGEFMLGTARPR